MQNFDVEKKGYNKSQVQKTINELVEDYENKLLLQKNRIAELKKEIEQLKEQLHTYQTKDKNISGALVAAVETAQEIESNSKNIYDIEIKRLRLLYNKWESFLNEMLQKNPEAKENFDPQVILKEFKKAIQETVENNFNSMQNSKKHNSEKARQNIQSLLMKMSSSNNRATTSSKPKTFKKATTSNANNIVNTKPIKREVKPSEHNLQNAKAKNDTLLEQKRMRQSTNHANIKPITNLTLSREDDYDSLVDKYLSINNLESENFANNAYAKQLTKKIEKEKPKQNHLYPEPNETGFDLQEALNPKEDLGEIMKSFDFFDNNEDN
jgi:cell division septum initiation protein DivIVA